MVWALLVILGLYFVGAVLIQARLTLQNRMFDWNNESTWWRLSLTRAV